MGFESLYKQTVTVFNRVETAETTLWYPTVIENVHLIIDRAIIISTYGEQAQDNAKLHIRYVPSGDDAIVAGKTYMTPKVFRKQGNPSSDITFAFGDRFDFIMAGAYGESGPFDDDDFKGGFFNYMNKTYDEVFAITNVSKFNLIPHFEITAK